MELLRALLSETEVQKGKDHFVTDIEKDTIENTDFRRVLYTTKNTQLVLMSIPPGGDIGEEVHTTIAQFFRVEKGSGQVIFNGKQYHIEDGSAFIIPQETRHNIVNTSDTEDLKLYTLYAPPNHKKNTVHKTKADAMTNEEHFDGRTDV